MPEEILLKIFFSGLSEDYWQGRNHIPLNVSHTNHALRRLALSSPCLWTKIGFSLDDDDDDGTDVDEGLQTRAACTAKLFELWIERSGSSPLICTTEVSRFGRMAERIFRLLLREQWRLRSITLAFEYIGSSRPGFHFDLTNMPNLQKLDLAFMDDEEEVFTLDLSHSKQLRHLNLRQTRSHRWREITKSIQGQQLLHLRLDLEDSPRDTFLITSLTMFPQLAHLDLRLTFNYGISLLSEMPNASPILLPKLRVLKLGIGCGDLLNYFTAPSLVSLDTYDSTMTDLNEEGLIIYEYLQRSNPPLETLKLAFTYLPNRDLLRNILRELHTVQIFIINHRNSRTSYTELDDLHNHSQINDLWSLLSINSPSTACLLPNLSRLAYYRSCQDAYKKRKEQVIIIADMLVSRWKYSPDFCFQGKHEYVREGPSKNFYCLLENMKDIRDCVSNGCSMIIKDLQDYIEEIRK